MSEKDGDTVHGPELLLELEEVLRERATSTDPGSYTAKLLRGDPARIRAKIGEEAFEVVLASEREDRANLAAEVADLWFHSMLLMRKHGVDLSAVLSELADRRGKRRAPKG
jgi:phosphoribosyl-ATP pyrophosphohydrolase/phosphoribosyl-AMP cyclohydrolase